MRLIALILGGIAYIIYPNENDDNHHMLRFICSILLGIIAIGCFFCAPSAEFDPWHE